MPDRGVVGALRLMVPLSPERPLEVALQAQRVGLSWGTLFPLWPPPTNFREPQFLRLTQGSCPAGECQGECRGE